MGGNREQRGVDWLGLGVENERGGLTPTVSNTTANKQTHGGWGGGGENNREQRGVDWLVD